MFRSVEPFVGVSVRDGFGPSRSVGVRLGVRVRVGVSQG